MASVLCDIYRVRCEVVAWRSSYMKRLDYTFSCWWTLSSSGWAPVKPPESRSASWKHSVSRGEHKAGADHLPMRAGAQQADGRNVSQIIDDSWCTKYLTPMFSEGLWPVRSWRRVRRATASGQFCIGSEVGSSVCRESGLWRCWMPGSGTWPTLSGPNWDWTSSSPS